MNKGDFAKCMVYLGTAYGKEYTRKEVEQHYEFLKDYPFEIVNKAIKNIIKSMRYLPKINELLEECKKVEHQEQGIMIEKLKDEGYFKDLKEYEKAVNFYHEGNIPSWILKETSKHSQIENQEIKLINS